MAVHARRDRRLDLLRPAESQALLQRRSTFISRPFSVTTSTSSGWIAAFRHNVLLAVAVSLGNVFS